MDDQIWDLERGSWLEGVEHYEAHLHDDALMIFPGMGILDRASALDSLRTATRWAGVQKNERRTIATEEVFFLAYAAVAFRDGDRPYCAHCGSSYVRQEKGWRLMAHQQALLA